MATVEPVYKKPGKKKKTKLHNFVVVTETNLPTKTSRQSAYNEEKKEFYVVKSKCKKCDIEKPPNDVSTTNTSSTCSTTNASSGSESEQQQPFPFNSEWLNEQDRERLDAITFEEEGHQRRLMRKTAETQCRQQKNKLDLLKGLRLYNIMRIAVEKRIEDALDKDLPSVNLDAFVILEDGTFLPYNAEYGGCPYEFVKNKFAPLGHLDRKQLFIELLQHPTQLKQLLHLFQYLDNPPKEKDWLNNNKLPYVIYKRQIELIDGQLVDNLDFWGHLENLFEPKVTGFYYAIIVCFVLYSKEEEEAEDVIGLKTNNEI